MVEQSQHQGTSTWKSNFARDSPILPIGPLRLGRKALGPEHEIIVGKAVVADELRSDARGVTHQAGRHLLAAVLAVGVADLDRPAGGQVRRQPLDHA